MRTLIGSAILISVGLGGVLVAACGQQSPKPHVLLVVLDNVRADRTSLCGYTRPTTPLLTKFCKRDGAACVCSAEAPGSWTVPSHASYFTGTEVPRHGAGTGTAGEGVRVTAGTHARPLDEKLPTLAEHFSDLDYQTVSVSGNPLVSPLSGLTRGFDLESHADAFESLRGQRLVARLREVLATQDPERPLFLFLNIADAHRPWSEIPAGLDWLPRRDRLGFPQKAGKPNPERQRYIRGQMPVEAARELLAHLDDVYDWAVRRADDTFGRALKVLDEDGWTSGTRPVRIIVTSDHGEHLGEHQLMGHAGPYLYEEITRVPLAVFDSTRPQNLPDKLSAIAAYDLARDGAYHRRPIRAAAFASDTWPAWYGESVGFSPAAAVWVGKTKMVYQDGTLRRYDLASDPGETHPDSLDAEPQARQLEAMLAALESIVEGEPLDAEMLKALEALGYL